ncbi:DNA mismatch endonuclease Vsr [Parapedobacter luteus]|uniref:DNA mismatch endonuclease Vsr n=1 Tax=Parapedobacter luteus TaxID=623280 RepID=A0A1T5CS32_9SPHI|nr:hypothetical protein [Parapedobacter luteus]SKB62234.1 DNA mismatch endonuclease Vsr [Parapedobacter luteus]
MYLVGRIQFWHGYQWGKTKAIIKSNRDFWIPKIERNIQRDKENNATLIAMGYTVFRFWGEDVRTCMSINELGLLAINTILHNDNVLTPIWCNEAQLPQAIGKRYFLQKAAASIRKPASRPL